MFLFRRLVVLASLAILVLLSACDDRGRNLPTADDASNSLSGNFPDQHVFSSDGSVPPQLLTQIRNRFALANMSVYQPEVIYKPGRPVPVLLLLPPEGGDENYYADRGLEQLANDMIASGEIQPMMIVTIENPSIFGGFFYGNSWPAGFYDQVFGYGMLDYLQTKFPGLTLAVSDQQKFGVGGIGQGAYGAFRAAIQNPTEFGSISVLDGPLDFDGATGSGGLIPLMDLALAEQPTLTDANIRNSTFNGGFDTSSAYPISQMFVGGSFAFSPHDTALQLTLSTTPQGLIEVTINQRWQITDSASLIDSIISGGQGNQNFHFHLPFLPSQTPYDPIWQGFWMPNNLDSLHENSATADPLSGVNMWIMSSTQARWNYHEMTQSWYNTLVNDFGYNTVEYGEYEGYDGNPATEGQYVYDMLRQMLIFHSESFGN